MFTIRDIANKLRPFIITQRLIDIAARLLIAGAGVGIAFSVAIFLLKSPIYSLVGLAGLLAFRPVRRHAIIANLERHIGFKGELLNSLQLACISVHNKEHYSQELIDSCIHRTAERFSVIDLRPHHDYSRLRSALVIFVVSVAFCLIQPALMPARFWYGLTHDIQYNIRPGHGTYQRGTEVKLEIALNGVYLPQQAVLVLEYPAHKIRHRVPIINNQGVFSAHLDQGFSYHFSFLDQRTVDYTVDVYETIYIEELQFRLQYPRYTHLPDEIRSGRQLIVPTMTRVSLKGKASQPLNSVQLVYQDTLSFEHDGKEFTGTFIVEESGTAILLLISQSTLQEPIGIYAIPDLAPLVDIFYPGYDVKMPNSMKVPIAIRCSDDYGLRGGLFYYKLDNLHEQPLTIRQESTEDTVYFEWDLSDLNMFPGDELGYYAEIIDNTGNRTRSKTYYISFPTMEEIYEAIGNQENAIQSILDSLTQQHHQRMDELSEIENRIMKERSFEWADKEKLQDLINQESGILDEVRKWQQEVERTIENMEEGIVVDQESIERILEIAKILNELAPHELQEALQNLELQLNKRPEDIQQALENMKAHQEEFAKALERTLELLRRYQQEELLKRLAEKAKEIAQRATELDSLSAAQDDADLSSEQSELNRDIEELARDLNELSSSETLEQEIKMQLAELAQEAAESAQMPPSSEKSSQLDRMAADLAQLYEQLTQGRTAQLRKKLMEILNQLIDASKAQEEIAENNADFDAELQNQIINAVEVLAESLYTQQTKSLYVSPNMGKNLAKALTHMKKAIQIEQHALNAREAMRLINIVCYEMLQNLERAAEGTGSSTGMDKFMQQLGNLSQGQMSINQSLNGIFPIPMPGPSAQQKTQMQKLAGQQRALRQALEGLRNESGAQQFQALLDDLIEKMKETEEELYQYKLDRTLIERQQVVLSRLLDAQRSIRKEDYQKQRQSKPGKDLPRQQSPSPLSAELGKDRLRELLQQALKENYPKEYELYIRQYFRTLIEQQ